MPVPIAIRVNMLRLRARIEFQPRTKKGQPAHSTTGVARTSWTITLTLRGTRSARPGISSPMASANSGTVSTRPIQNRRVMSTSSGLGPVSAATVIGSSAMPHFGQLPGSSRTISGCIGQVYCTLVAATGCAGSSAMPHFGQAAGTSDSTPGHIGQI